MTEIDDRILKLRVQLNELERRKDAKRAQDATRPWLQLWIEVGDVVFGQGKTREERNEWLQSILDFLNDNIPALKIECWAPGYGPPRPRLQDLKDIWESKIRD